MFFPRVKKDHPSITKGAQLWPFIKYIVEKTLFQKKKRFYICNISYGCIGENLMMTKLQEVFHTTECLLLNGFLKMPKEKKKGTLLKYNTFSLYSPTLHLSIVIEKRNRCLENRCLDFMNYTKYLTGLPIGRSLSWLFSILPTHS